MNTKYAKFINAITGYKREILQMTIVLMTGADRLSLRWHEWTLACGYTDDVYSAIW